MGSHLAALAEIADQPASDLHTRIFTPKEISFIFPWALFEPASCGVSVSQYLQARLQPCLRFSKRLKPTSARNFMNKEREPMGFPKFTVLDTKTGDEAENTVNTSKLCETIKANGDPGVWITETDISIAAAKVSSCLPLCAAATKQWKGVLKAMGDSLPPAYTPGEGIYNNLDVVSLMSLYTPKEGVAVTCTVIQCPEKSSSASDNQNSDSSNGQNPSQNTQPPANQPSGGNTGGTTGSTVDNGGSSAGTAGGSVSGTGTPGAGSEKNGETRELKEEAKDLSKEKKDKLSTTITGQGVSEAEVGGVSPPAASPAAAAAERAAGVEGGIRVRRLAEGGGVTQEESFNALVCIFKPKTLTKGVAPFQ
ncbi:SAG family member [Eimeria maxima]|uniref:SAG family member n=1 Tax=Eimeria maxima TaxID=5804 RepID=U6M3X8_EIMMA|nr:SAG family member [Eimeria maxima]CDJ58716.1 SAG family member [Eimeria maxima]